MTTREEREAEVAVLVARALDPEDDYDGHHGDDRSDHLVYDSLKTEA